MVFNGDTMVFSGDTIVILWWYYGDTMVMNGDECGDDWQGSLVINHG